MAVPLLTAVEWISDALYMLFDQITANEIHAGEDTELNLSNVVCGKCYYYFTDNQGSRKLLNSNFAFLPSLMQGSEPVIVDTGEISATAVYMPKDNASVSPSTQLYSGNQYESFLALRGGDFYTFSFDGYGVDFSSIPNNVIYFNTRNTPSSYFYDGRASFASYAGNYYFLAEVPLYSSSPNYTGHDITFTTMTSVHNINANYAYIPSGTYTFDEVRIALINYYNTIIDGGEQISIDTPDIPTFKDLQTEPTEPSSPSGGCNIDYDEILSEGELESILNQETYYLAEVETDISSLTLQPAPEVFLPEKIVEAGAGMFSIGFNALSDIGLLSPFLSVAVFTFFIRAFRR